MAEVKTVSSKQKAVSSQKSSETAHESSFRSPLDRHSHAPNVKLAARAHPLGAGKVTVGMETVCSLPSEEEQRAGFYCAEGERLVSVFPDRFRLIPAVTSDRVTE